MHSSSIFLYILRTVPDFKLYRKTVIKCEGMLVTQEHLKNTFKSPLPGVDDMTVLALLYCDSHDEILFHCIVDPLKFLSSCRCSWPVSPKKITKPKAIILAGDMEILILCILLTSLPLWKVVEYP